MSQNGIQTGIHAGFLIVGQPQLSIPPGLRDYTAPPNQCPASCTARFTQPLRLLYTGLHMHSIGRRIVTQVG